MGSALTIGDVVLVLDDFYNVKIELVRPTLTFQIYDAALQEHRTWLKGIDPGLTGRPLVEDLTGSDALHDSGVRAVHLVCTGLGQFLPLPKATRQFLLKVRDTFAPSLGATQESYADEAAAAKAREDDLEEMEPTLKAFPVAPETTLYTLVSTYIEAGKEIDTLLSQRAETKADAEHKRTKEANRIRSQTIRTINQFRETLVAEIKSKPELPRDLESRVFSYYDQLQETREAALSRAETEEEAPESSDTLIETEAGEASPPESTA